jgi:hypothetical protein
LRWRGRRPKRGREDFEKKMPCLKLPRRLLTLECAQVGCAKRLG